MRRHRAFVETHVAVVAVARKIYYTRGFFDESGE